MPLAIVLALAASLGIHVAALFGTDVELFGGGPEELPPLQAELQPMPSPLTPETTAKSSPPAPAPIAKAHGKPRLRAKPMPRNVAPVASPLPQTEAMPATPASAANGDGLPASETVVPKPAPEPAKPRLPASGTLRFAIFYGTQGFQIGRAEHRWEFTEDGRYRLSGMTETVGLVNLFKSVRFENESAGRLVASGLQPEQYRTRKNGREGNENADFAWATEEVRLSRDGSVRSIAPGTQDILSLNYQLAFLPRPEQGNSIGVVTGKKYERYALDSLGEETLETPAGTFRTLHLRAMTDSSTEIWIALDRHRLPVKIRFSDRKGDVYEQIVTEIGITAAGSHAAQAAVREGFPSENAPLEPEK